MAIKRCKSSFAATVNGAPRVVTVGTLIDSEDPIFKGRETYFEDVETYVSGQTVRGAEQATAEPGERRSLSRPVKKTTARKARTETQEKGGEQ